MTTPLARCWLRPLRWVSFQARHASALTVRCKQRATDAAPCWSAVCSSMTNHVTPPPGMQRPLWVRNRFSCHPGGAMIRWYCRRTCFTVNISEGGQKACWQFLACHVATDNDTRTTDSETVPSERAAVLPAERQWFGPTVSLRRQRPSENVFVTQGGWARRRCMLPCLLMAGWGRDSENSTGGTRECWKNTDCHRGGLQGLQHSLQISPMYRTSSRKKHWPEGGSACWMTPDLLHFGK